MTGLTCVFFASYFSLLGSSSRLEKQQKNFKDANLRDIARQKAVARNAASTSTQADTPKYRDRASERRVLFNQPNAPVPEKDMSLSKPGKQRQAEGPPAPPSPPPPVLNPGQDDNNVGNKLLKMMGWKEGTGLGATGDGRVDPMFVCSSVDGRLLY